MSKARKLLNLPINQKLILFVAINATKDSRKGFDIAIRSLKTFLDNYKSKVNVSLVVIGQKI